jgi:23S rRNA (adenine2503-C2)-methyltransferase
MSAKPIEAEIDPSVQRIDAGGLLLEELRAALEEWGERPYRALQIMNWLHVRRVNSFGAMSNLPAPLRDKLARRFKLSPPSRAVVSKSPDGTRKLLIQLCDGEAIESVIIPADHRLSFCLSSQVGCAMGCSFCATARMRLHRNLNAQEIIGQLDAAEFHLEGDERLTNYIFMGMGEPLANYAQLLRALRIMTAKWGRAISPRRITVSTVGLVPAMQRLLVDTSVNLAVSLHATTDEIRDVLAPINRRYPLEVLLDACRELPLPSRRRIMFEYVMLRGVNDSREDAKRLVKLLGSLRAKVNLIFFNPFPGSQHDASSRAAVEDFQAILRRGSLVATIRESRGRDIEAACGQLFANQRGEALDGSQCATAR